MRPKVKGPFTTQDVADWNEALKTCARVREECEMGKLAGFPCDEQLNACKALEEQLTKMKSVYAPGLS
jgi:hypothetical protein